MLLHRRRAILRVRLGQLGPLGLSGHHNRRWIHDVLPLRVRHIFLAPLITIIIN